MRKVFLFLFFVSLVSCGGGDDDNPVSDPVQQSLPELSTKPIINIETNSASTGGNISSNGNSSITQKGVCWSKNPNPIISANSFSVDGTGNSSYVSELDDLEPSTTYYVRAYATNSVGTQYGNELSFVTADDSNENVYSGSIILRNQSDVDSFGANNYTQINGSLQIWAAPIGNEITDLSPLNTIKSVSNQLSIFGCETITTLQGLNNLESVGLNFQIEGNSSLTDLNGLGSLVSVGTEFKISGNNELTSLNGLTSINSVGTLFIFYNEKLNDLDGLVSLNQISDSLDVSWNTNLLNIEGLGNVTSIGENILFDRNAKLTNLNGLENINSINGYLDIRDNIMLLNIDALSNLETIGSNLTLLGNNQLININGLSSLNHVGGTNIRFEANHSVIDLSGFASLTSFDGEILIKQTGLNSLNGLHNLTSVGSLIIIQNYPLTDIPFNSLTTIETNIHINENGTLSSLDGLSNLTQLNNVYITQNDLLTDYCGFQSSTMVNLGGNYVVSNNAYNPTLQDLIDGNCSQ